MNAGSLRHRVAIQTNTPTQDVSGKPADSWATSTTVWARIEPVSARERLLAEQTEARITHKITMRHNSTITEESRLVHASRNFYPESIINTEERDRELIVLCEERK